MPTVPIHITIDKDTLEIVKRELEAYNKAGPAVSLSRFISFIVRQYFNQITFKD